MLTILKLQVPTQTVTYSPTSTSSPVTPASSTSSTSVVAVIGVVAALDVIAALIAIYLVATCSRRGRATGHAATAERDMEKTEKEYIEAPDGQIFEAAVPDQAKGRHELSTSRMFELPAS